VQSKTQMLVAKQCGLYGQVILETKVRIVYQTMFGNVYKLCLIHMMNNDGVISFIDLRTCFSQRGKNVPDSEIRRWIAEKDTVGDGVVTLDEFLASYGNLLHRGEQSRAIMQKALKQEEELRNKEMTERKDDDSDDDNTSKWRKGNRRYHSTDDDDSSEDSDRGRRHKDRRRKKNEKKKKSRRRKYSENDETSDDSDSDEERWRRKRRNRRRAAGAKDKN